MIRSMSSDDTPAVLVLAVDSGLFPADEVDNVQHLLDDYFTRTAEAGHACVVIERTDARDGLDGLDGLDGVAYYEPKQATSGTWELTMIAVRRAGQGQGTGSRLMRHVEDDLRSRGQRLLLVQTSGVASFARTRAFYDRNGYEQEARVRDYYETGDDMVLYRKTLEAFSQGEVTTTGPTTTSG